MPFFADRVAETTNTVGLANFVLGGAKVGYQSFAAGVGYGTVMYYIAVHQTSGQWERGVGSVTAAPDTLARTTILTGSSGPATKVNFAAGVLDVFIDLPASAVIAVDPVTGKVGIPAGLVMVGSLDLSAAVVAGLLDISGVGGGRIKYPATQNPSADPNTNDDYEEGSFSGLLVPSGGSITNGTATCRYTKNGRVVTITGMVQASAVAAPTGDLQISGLPFTSAADNFAGVALEADGLNATATTAMQAYVTASAAFIRIQRFAAGASAVPAADVKAGSSFIFQCSYIAA